MTVGLAVFIGLTLLNTSLGDAWRNASFDYLFRFGSHHVTNQLVFVLMDNEGFEYFHQSREQPWDRSLHAQLLNRLADDGCALVVVDSFLRSPRLPGSDDALAQAMQRLHRLVLMAESAQVIRPGLAGVKPILPAEPFLRAASNHWGIAWVDPDPGAVVRRHWPFPSPGPYPSMAETAAQLMGTVSDGREQERWLRYYGVAGPGLKIGYRFALSQPPGFYRNKIVFIGTQPQTTLPDGELDKFSTPYTRWTGEASGGVEIMATTFLNLVKEDWLRRLPNSAELVFIVAFGGVWGLLLTRISTRTALLASVLGFASMAMTAILCGHYCNYWFPWLIVAGAQMPCVLASVLVFRGYSVWKYSPQANQRPGKTPKISGFKLFPPAIGEGAYGKVWLARNRDGQWRALKAVYLDKFERQEPYEREYNGITKYQAVSGRHPALLPIEYLSKKQDGYFYYSMPLADSLIQGWQKQTKAYQPHDLSAERSRVPGGKLPPRECVKIGIVLAQALDFLHRNGLTHRDVKPQNVVFVAGQPKLADLGLVTELRAQDQIKTLVGTPGYMPPHPEPPGTVAADIFALGMVLYYLSTGCNAASFPDIPTEIIADGSARDFLALNAIIVKACQPDLTARFKSAFDFQQALADLQEKFDQPSS